MGIRGTLMWNYFEIWLLAMEMLFKCFTIFSSGDHFVETPTLLCHVIKTKFLSKSRVCNSSITISSVMWPLCICTAYIFLLCCKFQIIILKTAGEIAETRTLQCHVYKINFLSKSRVCLFVCIELLRPSQPNWVMSCPVSLPNHTFTVQA